MNSFSPTSVSVPPPKREHPCTGPRPDNQSGPSGPTLPATERNTMPSVGKHRRPDNSTFKRRLAAAGTGIALPVIAVSTANAATKAPVADTSVVTAHHEAPKPKAGAESATATTTAKAAPKHRTHVVKHGETLNGIARHEGVSPGALYRDNTAVIGPNENLIIPGQVLTVPDGTAPAHHETKAHHGKGEHTGPQHAKPAHAEPAHAKPQHAKPAQPKPAHAGPTHAKPAQPKPHTSPQQPQQPQQPRPAQPPAPPVQQPKYGNNLHGWILQSLDILKERGIPASYNGIMRNVMRESSGNPKAINLWDSNAKAGIPSKGLLQVIDPTFRAYHVPGTSNDSYDPVANITAACNYAAAKYGSIDNVNSAY